MFYNIFLDIARPNQIFFQDTATPTMSGIIDLHQHVFFFLIFIFCVVAFQIYDVLTFFRLKEFIFSSILKKNENYKKYKFFLLNQKNELLSKQLIYSFYGKKLYFHVLNKFFKDNGEFLVKFIKIKYYFKLLKFKNLFFIKSNKINLKNLQLLNNILILTKKKELKKKLFLLLLNFFSKNLNNSFTIRNFSYGFFSFGGFSLFRSLENNFKSSLIKLSLMSKIHKFNHNTTIETIWTLIPITIVLAIAIPSFVLMYALDAALDGVITIKAIGHQWYWSYECEFPDILNYLEDEFAFDNSNMINIHFDSYMIYTDQLKEGEIRLLEVDKALFLPFRVPVDIVITSVDVIHSWAVPSLGVKVDAVPGRLNHIGIFIERKGVFYGQCSELCGVNHGFMPIKVVAVSYSDYINYCYTLFLSSAENLDHLFKTSYFI